jgi:hypothetical protein
MSDDLADSTAQLEVLLKLIMRETDPQRFDELGAAIWRVLDERELLTAQLRSRATDQLLRKNAA